jgi:hypothetical protein
MTTPPVTVDTAGELVEIDCALGWVDELLAEAIGDLGRSGVGSPTVGVRVERSREAFPVRGWEPVTRGAWRQGTRVVVANGCSSGFDVHLECSGERADFTYRWRPPARERVAARLLPARFHLLSRAVLLQYPAIWWASTRSRAPLHASVCTAGGVGCLLAGPGGVGKSTLLQLELEQGGHAACDNLCVSDGVIAHGVVEPLRVEGGTGRRMPHGRREAVLGRRVPALQPERVLVIRRGLGEAGTVRRCDPAEAARSLTAGTYMAGELRRFWGFAATLALASGVGPAHPPVAEIAGDLCRRLPCLQVDVPARPGPSLGELLANGVNGVEERLWT